MSSKFRRFLSTDSCGDKCPMSGNLNIPGGGGVRYKAITNVDFTVNSGTIAWVDTDVSSAIPSGGAKCLVFSLTSSSTPVTGVRESGSSAAPVIIAVNPSILTFIVTPSATGHCDLYRDNSANNVYTVIGAFV